MSTKNQPRTGARCSCKPGIARDNCANCEGTGWVIDFAKIRATPWQAFATADTIIDTIDPRTGNSSSFGKNLEQVRAEYPTAEVVSIAEWCKAKATRQRSPIEWEETTREKYWEALEALPPAAMHAGAFLLGEPMDHDAGNGQPRFTAYKEQPRGKFFASNRPITHAEFCAVFGKTSFDYIS